MPPKVTELRCSTCHKLLIGFSSDFDGEIGTRCRRCKTDVEWGLEPVPEARILCKCHRWLARGVLRAGSFRIFCPAHKSLVIVRPNQVLVTERRIAPADGFDVVEMMETRWLLLRRDRARQSAEVAAGLRFDVFNRDGFRCRYCGRGPEQGMFLEADHVMPRAAGGLDSMANLVTSCSDCNRGKAAKMLTSGSIPP